MIVGIDASRNRSGGAKAHLIGILKEGDPHKYGIREVHLWAYKGLLDAIPDLKWLIKHNPIEVEQSLFSQIWWQRFKFPNEARQCGCSIVFNTDAGSVSPFQPSVTLSRDMLSYEPGVIKIFGLSRARLRLILLRYIQNRSFRNSFGVIFLTQYAAEVIQRSCGALLRVVIIPHGVGADFRKVIPKSENSDRAEKIYRVLYVSHVELYKYQWVVIRAVEKLRVAGYHVELILVGSSSGKAKQLLEKQIDESDVNREWVNQMGFVQQKELPACLAKADIFVFASSCENMPNTLVEAMAVGLPIACSNRGPMPDVLKDGGVYFDPENAESIAVALERLIVDEELRLCLARRAQQLSEQYSWSRCADETFSFIAEMYRRMENG